MKSVRANGQGEVMKCVLAILIAIATVPTWAQQEITRLQCDGKYSNFLTGYRDVPDKGGYVEIQKSSVKVVSVIGFEGTYAVYSANEAECASNIQKTSSFKAASIGLAASYNSINRVRNRDRVTSAALINSGEAHVPQRVPCSRLASYDMNRVGDTLLHLGPNEELIRAFTSGNVEFVVIGGLAVAWYCSDRQADDMDLLVNPTAENSARISQALGSLPSIPINGFTNDSFANPGLRVPLKKFYYAELLTPRKDDPAFSEVAKDAVNAKLFGIPVQLASAARLIRMKEQTVVSLEAERQKHVDDIGRLRRHAV